MQEEGRSVAAKELNLVLQQLRKTIRRQLAGELSDGELLRRFATGRDEAAFEVLVWRHGPSLLSLCHRLRCDSHDAEDVLQATFLTLVKKAGSIGKGESLGSWLYKVAFRIALRTKEDSRRRTASAIPMQDLPAPDASDNGVLNERRLSVDEAIEALPEKYRTVVVLCYLQGKSHKEIASELGCPISTVSTRIARAHQMLRDNLAHRGVVLSAGLLGVTLSQHAVSAEMYGPLTSSIVNAAARVAAGQPVAMVVSAKVAALTEGVVQAMFVTKLKIATALLLAAAVIAGTAVVSHQTTSAEPPARAETKEAALEKGFAQESLADPLARYRVISEKGDPLPEGAVGRLGTARFRHGFTTVGVAFSPNGKVLASAGNEGGGVCLWDVATGRSSQRLPLPSSAKAVAFSPDGKSLVTAGDVVRMIDVVTGKEIRQFRGPKKFLDLGIVAFSPDGLTVAAGESRGNRAFGPKGGIVILWDAATGKELRRLEGHDDVNSIAFSPKDGKILASASSDHKVRLWDVASGKQLGVLESDSPVLAVAFSPGGKILASAGEDSVVRLWDVDTGKQLHQPKADQGKAKSLDVVFSPDGALLATRGDNGIIHVWDAGTGKELRRWDTGASYGGGLSFSPDGRVLASGGGSCIRLWDPDTGKEINPGAGHTAAVWLLQFAPDGKALFSYGLDRKVLQWDLATGRASEGSLGSTGAQLGLRATDISPDGKLLARFSYTGEKEDRSIRLSDAATGKELLSLNTTSQYTRVIRFSPNGELLAASSEDGIRVWNLATGKILHHFTERDVSPWGLAFSPDGKTLAFLGDNQTIAVSEVATGKILRRWGRPDQYVRSLAYSPDGKSIITHGDPGKNIRVWDSASGKELAHFGGFESILCWAFSPSGRILAVAELLRDNVPGPDEAVTCTLHLLELYSGQEIRKIPMPQGSVRSLAFAPDGRALASGGGDSTILLWDMSARAKNPKVKPAALTAADLDRLWSDLAGDAPTADASLAALVLAPKQSVPFLQKRFKSAAVPADQVAKLIADLDSTTFAVREKATRDLQELGEGAEALVRKSLTGNPSLEARRRLEELLQHREKEALRPLRVVDALEEIGTAEARQALEMVASGAVNPRVSQAAASALKRLMISRSS